MPGAVVTAFFPCKFLKAFDLSCATVQSSLQAFCSPNVFWEGWKCCEVLCREDLRHVILKLCNQEVAAVHRCRLESDVFLVVVFKETFLEAGLVETWCERLPLVVPGETPGAIHTPRTFISTMRP